MSQKTYMPEVGSGDKRWVIIDAEAKNLGRVATRVARVLMGKHRRDYTPHLDSGDGVIVINASDVELSGNKEFKEMPLEHSGHIGGLKSANMGEMLEENPELLVEKAVKGMLPKNRLRDKMLKHLRIYTGSDHPHGAQDPVEFDWETETVKDD